MKKQKKNNNINQKNTGNLVLVKNNKVEKPTKGKVFSRFSLRIFLLLILLSYAVFMLVVFFSDPVNKVTVVQGKISEESSVEGFVIRDETVLSTNMVSDTVLLKPEGSRVGKNETIATYVSKSNQALEKKIKDLDVKIQLAMQEQTNLYSTDTRNIELQIEDVIDEMAVTKELQKLKQYKSQIDTLVQKKAKIVGELSTSGSYINNLIKERNEYEKELNQSTDYLKTSIAGVMSTRIDNYENILTVNNIENITYEQLEQYKFRADEIIPNSTKAIKIIDNYYCYLLVDITDKYVGTIDAGSNIKIRLNYADSTTVAQVMEVREENGRKVLVLKITKNVEELINYRKVSFDIIWWEYEGLKIPNSAVKGEGNNATVVLYKYGIEYNVRVKILKQNTDYAIITDLSATDIAELNLSSDDVKKSINIYDELIIKS